MRSVSNFPATSCVTNCSLIGVALSQSERSKLSTPTRRVLAPANGDTELPHAAE